MPERDEGTELVTEPSGPGDLVLGLAAGYDAQTLAPYVRSLERVGYRGRTVLFVDDRDRDARVFLEASGIEAVPVRATYPQLWEWAHRLGVPRRATRLVEHLVLRALAPLASPRALGLYGRVAPLHPTALRYPLFLAYLTGRSAAGVRRVLLADTRDLFFQRDPFAFPLPSTGLAGFEEEATKPLRRCDANAAWLRNCYGEAALDELGDHPILCSGAILGDAGAVVRHVGAMLTEIARLAARRGVSPSGFDQACHNHLLRRAPTGPWRPYANGASPVLHLAHRPRERIRLSAAGEVENDDGTVVPMVHQWDRHADLFAGVLRAFV